VKSIIVPERQTILIPAKYQEVKQKVLDVKDFEFAGKQLLRIKHTLDNTVILNEMGFEIPSPILYYYDFPKAEGRHDPRPHQITSCAFHTLNRQSFNLSQPRTGKTLTGLWTFDYLRSIGKVKKLLIFTTLSTVTSVWINEVYKTFMDLGVVGVTGTYEDKLKALSQDVDIYVTNHDSVKTLEAEFVKRKDFDMIIWDEADNLTNSSSAMWKSFRKVIKPNQYVILATGTPTGENRPTDAWALAKLISPDRVPKYFGAFREKVMHQVSEYKWVPKKEANSVVYEVLQPAICFEKKDVLQLEEVTFAREQADLSPEQTQMFNEIKKEMVSEYDGKTVTAVNAADKILKLAQILLGVYKTGEDEYTTIPCRPRVDKILEIIGRTPHKAIVFLPFTGALRHYTEEISKHYSCEFVDGSVSGNKRTKIFHAFQNYDHPHVLIAHPKTTAHGLELSRADKIIWAGPVHSGRQYLQACERINSSKQENAMFTYLVGSHSIEWGIYDRLEQKKLTQAELLKMYKEVVREG